MGSGLSSSMKSSRASRELAFVAARVEDRPFSTIGVTATPRDLAGSAVSTYPT